MIFRDGVELMKLFIRLNYIVFGYFIVSSVNAFEIGAEFSAEAVQIIPGHPSMNAKMFISKNAVRTESMVSGNTMVEIVYTKEKRQVLLNQFSKTYIEQNALDNSANSTQVKTTSPCSGLVNVSCKNLGKEKINGRNTTKWEMTTKKNGRDFKSLHWLDKKYRMPLREQFQDGTVSTITMLGKEVVNSRKTEKWKFIATRPDGKSVESMQWYDPKLKMVIREELPGGFIRELRNIKVAKQDKKLFKIPSEYKKEVIPAIGQQRRMMPPRHR